MKTKIVRVFAGMALLALIACQPHHHDDHSALGPYLINSYYPCTTNVAFLTTTPTHLTFLGTGRGTQLSFGIATVGVGQIAFVNSTSTSLSPAPGFPVAIVGNSCAVAANAPTTTALSQCTQASTQITCPIAQANTYLFRLEFALSAPPGDISMRVQ